MECIFIAISALSDIPPCTANIEEQLKVSVDIFVNAFKVKRFYKNWNNPQNKCAFADHFTIVLGRIISISKFYHCI